MSDDFDCGFLVGVCMTWLVRLGVDMMIVLYIKRKRQ